MSSSLFGGGGGGGSATTSNQAPSNLSKYANIYGTDLFNWTNHFLNQPMPAGLNTQVAPFNPFQTQGLNFVGNTLPGLYNQESGNLAGLYGQAYSGITNPLGSANSALNLANMYTPAAQQAANVGANQLETFARGGNQSAANPTLQAFASGQFAGPNPYLNQYYNQAANQLTNQYQLGTQPALMAEFQQAGAFNSPGFNQAQGLAQSQYGNSLATLGAGIYEPAYEQGMQNMLAAGQGLQQNTQFNTANQLTAAGGLGNAAASMYGPAQALAGLSGNISSQAGNAYNTLAGLGAGIPQSLYGAANQTGQGLYGAGSAFQQQQQNLNNALQSNTALGVNWPFALLGQLGGGLGQAALGQGSSTATYNPSNGGGGFGSTLGGIGAGLGSAALNFLLP